MCTFFIDCQSLRERNLLPERMSREVTNSDPAPSRRLIWEEENGNFFPRSQRAGQFGGSFWRLNLTGHFGRSIWQVCSAGKFGKYLQQVLKKEK